ncbi:MAG: hypothetical protein WC692_03195 [Erythrobacter sp.]|jgi:hypothetical protein
MKGSDRRACLRLLGMVALVPSIAWPGQAGAMLPARLQFPAAPLVLTRQVERELHDGRLLVVVRSWRCQFIAAGRGAIVEGRQAGARVDAPPQLATLARMEEQRVDDGPFPALLDPSGRISGQGQVPAADLSRAIDEAAAILVAKGHRGEGLAEGRRFLSRLADAAGAAIAQIPEDLFFPARHESGFSRTLDLPGGLQGTVEVTIETRTDPVTGLLERSSRSAVTHIGNEARRNRELWTLTPA